MNLRKIIGKSYEDWNVMGMNEADISAWSLLIFLKYEIMRAQSNMLDQKKQGRSCETLGKKGHMSNRKDG